MSATAQYYLWTEARPFTKPNGLGSYDTIINISTEEPSPEILKSEFCILTTLEDTTEIARTLNVPCYAIEFIAELTNKTDPVYTLDRVAVPENLEIFDGLPSTESEYSITIRDYQNEYRYAIDEQRIKALYNEADVVLYMVDIIYTVHGRFEKPDGALVSPDDDAVINTWLKDNYVKAYEQAGLIDISDSWIGYQGPVIMGKMNGKTLNAFYSLNNKIN